jgi:hypothetical protein
MKLVFSSSKYSLFLTYLLTLPLLLETDYVLMLWLKIVPESSASFCRLVLINNLIWAMRGPIVTCFHAIGKIKAANLVCGSLFYLVIIVSYFCLKMGFPPESVFITTIAISLLVQITELVLLNRFITFSIWSYGYQILRFCFLVLVVSAILPYFLTLILTPGLGRFLIVGFSSLITVAISIYYFGINNETRDYVNQKIRTTIMRIKNK